VNYEPNGWGEGPRAHPLTGYVSYRAAVTGDKARLRPDSFADHYSQPRQFYISQTASEQGYIKAALVFELSKCTEPAIRARIVAHLRNIDDDLAADVAARLGLAELPAPAPAARPTNTDLRPSKALSIQLNAPDSFHGRVMGVMLSDGFDGTLLAALEKSVTKEGGLIQILAPRIGGVLCSKDNLHKVDEKIGSAPSVLFDAVAILPGQDSLATMPPALAFFERRLSALQTYRLVRARKRPCRDLWIVWGQRHRLLRADICGVRDLVCQRLQSLAPLAA
jgi:catalase